MRATSDLLSAVRSVLVAEAPARSCGGSGAPAAAWLLGRLLVCACVLLFGLVPAAARAQTTFGGAGSGAAQLQNPFGVAVEQSSGDVYLADGSNRRVEKFDSAGAFLRTWGWGVSDGGAHAEACTSGCRAGVPGSGAGQFDAPRGVAVDQATGDVYVVDRNNFRVEKFDSNGSFILAFGGGVDETTNANVCTAASGDTCGPGIAGTTNGSFASSWSFSGSYIAVDQSSGDVWVGDTNRIQEFDSSGNYVSQLTLTGAGTTTALAIDSTGDLYEASDAGSGVREYNTSGTLVGTLDAAGIPLELAVDPSDDVFIVDNSGGAGNHVLEFNSAGGQVADFGLNELINDGIAAGAAFGATVGEIYISQPSGTASDVAILTPPPLGPLVVSGSTSSSAIESTTATLHAQLNPEGDSTTYHFEYGTTTSYGSSTPETASIGSDFAYHPVSADLTGLSPATTYHYRVVATDSHGHVADGADATFTTLPAISFDLTTVAGVGTDGATLKASLNPNGLDTTYHFEYGTTASYGHSVPVPDGDIGSGTSDVAVAQAITGLTEATTYHYRVIATNSATPAGGLHGPDRTFTTPGPGAPFALPDNRGYEQVTPVDKNEFDSPWERQGVISDPNAAADGNSVAYFSFGAFAGAPAAQSFYLAARSASGWSSRPITPPQSTETASNCTGAGYAAFSPDLARGVFVDGTSVGLGSCGGADDPPLVPGEPRAGMNLFLRDNATDTYQLITAKPISGSALNAQWEFEGATPDLSHVVFDEPAQLTADAPAAGPNDHLLYEWSAGAVTLVGQIPTPPSTSCAGSACTPLAKDIADAGKAKLGDGTFTSGTSGTNRTAHAISDNGSRVFFEANGNLYMREGDTTTEVDASQGGGGSGGGTFQTASNDGSSVYFTDRRGLTSDASPSGNDLYRYDVDTGQLTDLTPNTLTPNADGVQGVLGSSDDASYLYFVSQGALSGTPNSHGDTATAGQPNLYLLHGGKTTFIAPLSPADKTDWSPNSEIPDFFTSRVTPDGSHLAFNSVRSLTGYDNSPPDPSDCTNKSDLSGTPVPCTEVFLYDAASGKLTCASCNPTGGQPIGSSMIDGVKELVPFDGGEGNNQANDISLQRNLSADGSRVFFDSSDALAPGDTNDKQDVYEWEAEGAGSCHQAGGCVFLISTGRSSDDSFFWDASTNGSDAFFITREQLVAQDTDGLQDLYDARVGGGLPFSAPVPVCSGDLCRGTLSGSPPVPVAASVTFSGPGNPMPAEPSPSHGKVRVLNRQVRGTSFLVAVKVPGRGRITVGGAGIRTVRESVPRAGTYRLRVRLTPKENRLLARRDGLTLKLRVGYSPPGARAALAIVRMTVKPALRHRSAHAGRSTHSSHHQVGGGR